MKRMLYFPSQLWETNLTYKSLYTFASAHSFSFPFTHICPFTTYWVQVQYFLRVFALAIPTASWYSHTMKSILISFRCFSVYRCLWESIYYHSRCKTTPCTSLYIYCSHALKNSMNVIVTFSCSVMHSYCLTQYRTSSKILIWYVMYANE